MGVVLWNAGASSVTCRVSVAGLDPEVFACDVRRQVFMETFRRRERQRVADPLPRLPRRDKAWSVTVPAGDMVKLYIGVGFSQAARGAVSGTIRIGPDGREPIALPVVLRLVEAPLPAAECFEYAAFFRVRRAKRAYVRLSKAAGKDLAAHGATMVTLHYQLPKAIFTKDGEIASISFTEHDAYLKCLAPHVRRLMVNWNSYPYSKLPRQDGEVLVVGSPAWERAFRNLLQAWFDHVTELGYRAEQFVQYPVDEPAGPEKTALTLRMWQLAKEATPKLPVLLTLCDYAGPKDTRALIPQADMVFVALPYRRSLPRRKIRFWGKYLGNDYSPLKAYRETILPMLREQRKRTGLRLFSYHVTGGKRDDVLIWNRAYPIVLMAEGYRGAAHWAYYDVNGSSWDDTDGPRKRPDHILIYDGGEDHPLNRSVNPTGEVIVPSIRWEALRAGLQDARILVALKNIVDTQRGEAGDEVSAVLTKCDELVQGEDRMTFGGVHELARRARMAYGRAMRR